MRLSHPLAAALFVALLSAAASPLAADDPIVVPQTWPDEWPIDPAPITGRTWPRLPPAQPTAEPATDAAARVVRTLERVQREQRDMAYQHRSRVNERRGQYRWDCSGMVSWVIAQAAPRAARPFTRTQRRRTSARGIHRLIERAPVHGERQGWERLTHIEQVRPGDVFAWRTAPGSPSRHTGHTGFVLERARAVDGLRDAYAIRIADSIVGPHQEDTRAEGTDGGLGFGVMVFLTDGAGHATHYGWHGTRTAGYGRTPIAFGRLHR